MNEALDVLTRYMAQAPQPSPDDLDKCRLRLESAIEEEIVERERLREQQNDLDKGSAIIRRPSRRHRYLLTASLAAAAVLLIGAVVLPLTTSQPGPRRGLASPSWRLVSSTTSPFRSLPPGGQTSLECVTDSVCYSPGAFTTQFFRTTDGGLIWQATAPIPLLRRGQQFSFSCVDAGTCAVIGQPTSSSSDVLATFAITTDGGHSWSVSRVPMPTGIPGAYPGRFACGDAAHCVLSVGGNAAAADSGQGTSSDPVGTFLSTDDGGKTWTQASSVPSAPAATVWTMRCTSEGSCIAVSAMGRIPNAWIVGLRSTDWGATWVAGPPAVYNAAPILYASCGDAKHCTLVPVSGPSSAPYEIATTSDAGLSWEVEGPSAGWLNMPTGVSCANATDCWVAMSKYDTHSPAGAYSEPTIESTHDGGITWSTIHLPSSKPPISDVLTLSCPPSGDGCMGIGNLQDHFIRPSKPGPLSGPLVISNLPPADQS